MRKILKSKLFLVIMTAIICITGTAYAAGQILAKDIEYKDTNVEEALDDLYDKANNYKYTEQDYQNYGSSMYEQGVSDTSNSNGYISGVITLNSTKANSVSLNFKPKYIMATIELANGSASSTDIFYYNYNIDSSKSYRYYRANAILQEFTLGATGSGMRISNVTNNGFEFYAPDIDGRKLYWTAFK